MTREIFNIRLAILFALVFLIFQPFLSFSQLKSAIKKGNITEVKRLITEGADVNKVSIYSPLAFAVIEGNIEIVKLLLDNGADVNKPITGGIGSASPLQTGVYNNRVEIVKLLLERGADIDYVCLVDGFTAKMAAQRKGYNHIIKIINDFEQAKLQNLILMTQTKQPVVNSTANNSIPIPEVDINIPVNNKVRPNTYALIVGNEDYSTYQTGLSIEVNVDYAINDAKIFKEYCQSTMGIPERQIKLLTNATSGQMAQGIEWLRNLAKIDNGKAELIFYYSGHGLPEEQTKEAYLIPVDISGNNVSLGIKLADVYKKLSEYPSARVAVFLDACFSGGARNQTLVSMKGVKVKPKDSYLDGNMVVLASSSGIESSGVYHEKQHGYMTYFLLKKIQETQGNITYKELFDYTIEVVQKETTLNGKTQTPQIIFSPQIENTWSSWNIAK